MKSDDERNKRDTDQGQEPQPNRRKPLFGDRTGNERYDKTAMVLVGCGAFFTPLILTPAVFDEDGLRAASLVLAAILQIYIIAHLALCSWKSNSHWLHAWDVRIVRSAVGLLFLLLFYLLCLFVWLAITLMIEFAIIGSTLRPMVD